MKTTILSLLLASVALGQQPPRPEPTLKAGSEVKIDAITAAKWIQGEAPKAFEPGKVYMLECWATWCGPCIAAIPHVNELHKKYYEKGFRVIGMNVWEREEEAAAVEKVTKFVKDKGDGMSYPVAYTAKDSAFATDWLKAAGVRGIPHAFLVKDGKLILTSHPSQITDQVVEALLSGDEGAKKAIAEIEAAKAAREKTSSVMMAFRKAMSSGDTDTMAASLAEFEKLDANNPYLPGMRLDLLVTKKDWPAAAKAIEELPAGPGRQMSLMMTAQKIAASKDDSYPVEFIKAVNKVHQAQMSEPGRTAGPHDYLTLTYLEWKSGNKEAATASAKKCAELATQKQAGPRSLPPAPFERFAKAVEAGTLPSLQEFSGWLGEAMQAAKPAKPAAPKP